MQRMRPERTLPMNRAVGLVAAICAVLALSDSAVAQAFSGPWDSAHEPPTIANPGVTTGSGDTEGSFQVTLSFGLTCPAGQPMPFTVTFANPEGSVSVPLADPCLGTWQNTPEAPAGFIIFADDGTVSPYYTASTSATLDPLETGPFLYQVTGPAGIVAQGTLKATVTPPEQIDQRHEIDNFINTCIDGNHETHSKEGGDLYCEVGGGTSIVRGHWPAPTPEYKALTRATTREWMLYAVTERFHYEPKRASVSDCKKLAAGRYRCTVSWQRGSSSFAGSVEVGNVNVFTGTFTYGLHIVSTNRHTHARHTYSVAY